MTGIGEHYRPTIRRYDSGVYRVVGTSEGTTLLYVADADGRRVNAGTTIRIATGELEEAFEPTPNPDDGFRFERALRTLGTWLYWSVRKPR